MEGSHDVKQRQMPRNKVVFLKHVQRKLVERSLERMGRDESAMSPALLLPNHAVLQKFRLIIGHMAVVNLYSGTVLVLLQPQYHFDETIIVISSTNPLINYIPSVNVALTVLRILASDFTGLRSTYPLNYMTAVGFRSLQMLKPSAVEEKLLISRIWLIFFFVHLFSFILMMFAYKTFRTSAEIAYRLNSMMYPGHFPLYIATDFSTQLSVPIIFVVHASLIIFAIMFVKLCAHKLNRYLHDNQENLNAATICSQKLLITCFHIKTYLLAAFTIPALLVSGIAKFTNVPQDIVTLVFSLVGWMPFLDGMLSIYYIMPYRRAVNQFLMNVCLKRKRMSTVNNGVEIQESRITCPSHQ
ncbi:hypothetical protein Tcan_10537 [Toxocara canis]|uniref:G protein-coupled receptor n=1 Tax=Toxocara canis TaxID=6265 RepID=A0A0B2V305_TOXCA|nr:hypothetical protein Tcan_10537 [Toxocara canis]